MRAMLACGGTGGHMFPALALASELMNRGHDVMLVSDERGADYVSAEWKMEVIPATAFFRRTLGEKIRAVGAFIEGRRRSIRLIGKHKPDVVIGAGGYASFPVIQAAKAKRIPFFLLEQNSVPGRVTRMTAKGAEEIYCGIPPASVTPGLDKMRKKIVVTGNILRESVICNGKTEGEKMLIQGGSQGARVLNELGYSLAQRLPGQRFIILTGKRDFEEISAKPRLTNVELVDFTEHPEELYAQTRVAISRAGAIALSELLANGIPSILVPLPYAVDDHQTHNALWAQSAGAAILLHQREIEKVETSLKELLADEPRRLEMSRKAREIVPLNAAAVIAERIERCLAA